MADDGQWYFCLKHMKVEHGAGCPDKVRMGPYATQAEAGLAIEHAKERNDSWENSD
ncbi:MAG: hypothetical protein ABIS86_08445 [Streptosporangiaceae bacterium]